MPELEIRKLDLSECGLVAVLMNSHYARQRSESYFRWQYFETPFSTVSLGAFDRGHLVGHFGLQRKPMSDGGVIDQVMDIIIDASCRGGDLFEAMWEQARKQLGPSSAPAMVLANPAGRQACVRRLGFCQVAEIESLALLREDVSLHQRGRSMSDVRLRLVFDGEGLDWRFRRHPEFRYHFHEGGAGEMIVSKLFQGDQCQGDLVYFRKQPPLELWAAACAHLFELGAVRVNCWAARGSQQRDSLVRLGFTSDGPQNRYFCVWSPDPNLLRADNWTLVSADTEHF